MRLITLLVSGVSLIALTVSGLLLQELRATSRPPPAYFINLPGASLLCVGAKPALGMQIIACSPVAGSDPAGSTPHIEHFSDSTLPPFN